MEHRDSITVHSVVKAPIEKVWEYWNMSEHITKWAFASDAWEAPMAENDLRTGGKFKIVMAAKDRSSSFDFTGTYTNIEKYSLIEYQIDDDRNVKVKFKNVPEGIMITEQFEPETLNPKEMQRSGWQAILDNFKKYTETK